MAPGNGGVAMHQGAGLSNEHARYTDEGKATCTTESLNYAGHEKVVEKVAEAWSESDDDEPDPSAAVYTSSCKESKVIMCRRWLRTCEERLPICELHHYGVGPRGAVPFAASLHANSHVEVLNLSDNGLGPIGVAAMLGALKGGGAPALTELDLSQNQARLPSQPCCCEAEWSCCTE
eukprot:6173652-Pleurochrysis_carterae.AAC.10